MTTGPTITVAIGSTTAATNVATASTTVATTATTVATATTTVATTDCCCYYCCYCCPIPASFCWKRTEAPALCVSNTSMLPMIVANTYTPRHVVARLKKA